MKIAVANLENEVEVHFGKSKSFMIYDVIGNQITSKEQLIAKNGGGCKSNIFFELRSIGVSVFLAGNIGKGAYNKFMLNGIEVLHGFSGSSEQAVINFLQGKLPKTPELCEGHKNHHHNH